MEKSLLNTKRSYLVQILLYLSFTVWWLYIRHLDLESTRNARQIWGATYQLLALYGGIVGLIISQKWGGYKSLLGKIILVFSLGLLLQVFGQTYSSYYVFHYVVESPPYPAIGDIGFFGSVLMYIYGVFLLSKVSGVGVSLRKLHNKIFAFLIPCIILCSSYFFFLQGYAFDWSNPIKVILDFGYPFGQAFYVSIAILSLSMSWHVLGGVMKKSILILIFALLFQYFSDSMFLYQSNQGNWFVGNINDFLYATSYFIMAISLINFGETFKRIKNS